MIAVFCLYRALPLAWLDNVTIFLAMPFVTARNEQFLFTRLKAPGVPAGTHYFVLIHFLPTCCS
jgi:hypothetical protein